MLVTNVRGKKWHRDQHFFHQNLKMSSTSLWASIEIETGAFQRCLTSLPAFWQSY